eukprot:TRINITY_DN5078_c0_g1_i3.p1 TRINITY_DN5078_c0_g1~~TRINITY_DN5078_c0_g1_i3.p1  ORF type:complete len:293 (-),score=36.12 TRINITY_DN5078_c0_g1_i3:75-953(-)
MKNFKNNQRAIELSIDNQVLFNLTSFICKIKEIFNRAETQKIQIPNLTPLDLSEFQISVEIKDGNKTITIPVTKFNSTREAKAIILGKDNLVRKYQKLTFDGMQLDQRALTVYNNKEKLLLLLLILNFKKTKDQNNIKESNNSIKELAKVDGFEVINGLLGTECSSYYGIKVTECSRILSGEETVQGGISLSDLQQNQKLSGYWEYDKKTLNKMNLQEDKIQKLMPESVKLKGDQKDDIWMTIVTLLWLEEFEQKNKQSWILFAKKAYEWLIKQGIYLDEHQYQKLKQLLFY